MEGLIPFLYKAIVQYKSGGQGGLIDTWLSESPSAAYMRLPGDSGRFQTPDVNVFRSSTPPPPPSTAQRNVAAVVDRSTVHRRVYA